MIRTQIRLTEAQAARLKSIAARKGISMAEVVRQALNSASAHGEEADPGARYERARRIAGRFRSGATNISIRHDDHLAGSFTS